MCFLILKNEKTVFKSKAKTAKQKKGIGWGVSMGANRTRECSGPVEAGCVNGLLCFSLLTSTCPCTRCGIKCGCLI